jgi:type III secretion system YscQ/HrcQ family protein
VNEGTPITRAARPAPEPPSEGPTAVDASPPGRARAPRPFDFGSLARLSREEVAWARTLGMPPGAASVSGAIGEDLTADLGVPFSLAFEGQEWMGEPPPALASPGCFAVVELPPQPGRIVVEADLDLALGLADRLLGGSGQRLQILRPPSLLERGILSYFFLRALARADERWLRAAGIRPRLVGVFAQWSLAAERHVVCTLAGKAAELRGSIRIYVPRCALESGALRARRTARLPGLLHGAAVELRAEAATMRLAGAELAALAPGDVVLCGMAAHPDGLVRRVRLRAAGGRGGLAAAASPGEGGFVLRIERYEPEREAVMSHLTEGERVLAEAEIPVAVELGRLVLPAQEIAALQPGDTLLLERPPGAPIELRAGGKLVARGELVDVEGELGFRVLSLAGAGPGE